jgi:hypothetical protein
MTAAACRGIPDIHRGGSVGHGHLDEPLGDGEGERCWGRGVGDGVADQVADQKRDIVASRLRQVPSA